MSNTSTIEFSDSDLKKIDHALLILEETFAGKLIKGNFTRNKPGEEPDAEIEDLSALPVDDVTEMTLSTPAFVNISQWNRDERTREQLNPIALRLKEIAQSVVHTNRAVLLRCWNSSNKY